MEAFKKAIEMSAGRRRRRRTEAYQGLARAYLALGKVDEAVATLKTAVETSPRTPAPARRYGDALKAKGDLDGAIAQYEEGVELAPTTEARLALAERVREEARGRQGRAALRGACSRRSRATARRSWGWRTCYLAMGDYAEAEKLLDARRRAKQPDTAALARLGIMHSRMRAAGQGGGAAGGGGEAKDPAQLEARAELGFLYLRGGDADKAVQVLSDVLAVEPRHSLALLYRATRCTGRARPRRPSSPSGRAAQVDPTFAEPHNALGQLLEAAKRKDEAKAEYAKAVELQPNHEDARRPSSGWAAAWRPRRRALSHEGQPSSTAPAITSTAPESCRRPGRSPWSTASPRAKAMEVLRSVSTAPAPPLRERREQQREGQRAQRPRRQHRGAGCCRTCRSTAPLSSRPGPREQQHGQRHPQRRARRAPEAGPPRRAPACRPRGSRRCTPRSRPPMPRRAPAGPEDAPAPSPPAPPPARAAPATVSGVRASPSHSTDTGHTSSSAPPRATVYASPRGAWRSERASENRYTPLAHPRAEPPHPPGPRGEGLPAQPQRPQPAQHHGHG